MEYTKPKIMRRIAFSQTEEARTCLGCGFVLLKKKLPTWLNRTTCPRCHTGMQFKHTDHGTVVITNEEFADWFVHDGHPAQIWIREENEDESSVSSMISKRARGIWPNSRFVRVDLEEEE